MTVADNVGFGLRMRRVARATIRERVQWALELVRLTGFDARRPHELSGGQQQRVAVARVLAAGASLLLFDEPFSNLDAKLRKEMQLELRDLQQRVGLAAVHVTHDQEEAMTMSDRLVIMNAGRMEQAGSPAEVYRHPGLHSWPSSWADVIGWQPAWPGPVRRRHGPPGSRRRG